MSENHPQYGWMAVVVIIVCVVAWIYTSNRPTIDNYGKDSTHNEQTRQDWPLSLHIGEGGCARFGADRLIGSLKGNNVKPITNASK